ncbi:hypothetical protein E4U13_002558 [Claviceps humidiphila]|uniref:BZIP domain-containing protein n=1 Tax=Claviceps humidiphila TaxID=1294629 RepID=A0A9P7Q1G8_9HYPO|nr:hypothetical protein E4U13_002558 [Claviceps humidiphila]
MPTFPEDVRYFERYKLSRPVPQIPAEHARWPEGSGQSGEDPSDPLPSIGSSCEGERLSRKRSSSTSSAELRGRLVDSVKRKYAKADPGVIDFDAGSHAAQLKRQSNAQASKRSRTRLKTMKEELDEAKKRERQERELRLKAEAENKTLKQKLENKR